MTWIYLGTTPIKDIYVWTTPVREVYLWTSKIWSKALVYEYNFVGKSSVDELIADGWTMVTNPGFDSTYGILWINSKIYMDNFDFSNANKITLTMNFYLKSWTTLWNRLANTVAKTQGSVGITWCQLAYTTSSPKRSVYIYDAKTDVSTTFSAWMHTETFVLDFTAKTYQETLRNTTTSFNYTTLSSTITDAQIASIRTWCNKLHLSINGNGTSWYGISNVSLVIE